jgi:His/Glu/Gln/Arg/opine family amino acid ABC transporter permease subunit
MMQYIPALLNGVTITVILMIASLAIGLLMAIVMTICSVSENILLKKIISALIFFVRGTPLLVQIFIIYFGFAQFEWVRTSIIWYIFKSPMSCAIIALAVNTACYTTVLLLGAINSVPKNEIAATEAIGMSKWLAMRRIILPRAFRIMLPAYSNEVMILLKSTSLASTITLMDIIGITQELISKTYNTVPFYIIAGILYLALNAVIMSIFKWLEYRNKVPNILSSY